MGRWQPAQLRGPLHFLRANLPGLQAQQHRPAVEDAVTTAVRPSDTGGVPPPHKTPPGKTKVSAFRHKTGQQDMRKSTEFGFLARDRAGQFTASFDSILADVGIDVREDPAAPPVG
ncbi:hypothetical protein GCM10017774_38790 [Lentzea cavernae]|uniref:Uncharacterized protein n=1 Tax=Lentzea cavernae TaxID=2020703 RepID=A0ABQ3MGE8_9PSEU|nr:hypothetical protein GCM10017774_38790 [Lentzea cavernae]